MKKLLFIDGCVSRESSRTERLAQAYLKKHRENGAYQLETVILEESGLMPLTGEMLQKREQLIQSGDFQHGMFRFARDFAAADELVIAVPFWDLSFPSALKVYLEHICIRNLTFRYSETGRPEGLTNIRSVTYVTTSGGPIGSWNFGYDYVKALMQGLFTIPDVRFISAEALDIAGNDPRAILNDAIRALSGGNGEPV